MIVEVKEDRKRSSVERRLCGSIDFFFLFFVFSLFFGLHIANEVMLVAKMCTHNTTTQHPEATLRVVPWPFPHPKWGDREIPH